MTTPNPWERLREAAEYFVDAALVYASEMTFRDFLAKWPKADSIDIIREAGLAKLRQALAALPANPPEQPVPDAERERAILDAFRWMGHADECREHRDGPETCDCGSDAARRKAVALMRSAPQPGTITCKCGAVATLLPIDCKSSVGWIGCAKCGHELMRWGPQPVPEEQPDDLGVMRDAKGLSERCRELRDRLVRLAQPVPAPPASDWRQRYDENASKFGKPQAKNLPMAAAIAMHALRDGLAALEAEVARMRKEKP